MTKIALMASALSGCLLATLATAPAAQAGFARAHKHHHAHKYVEYRIRRKYAPRFEHGHRPDCRQISKRATLTGNAYWRYAAHSCRHDHYRYAY